MEPLRPAVARQRLIASANGAGRDSRVTAQTKGARLVEPRSTSDMNENVTCRCAGAVS